MTRSRKDVQALAASLTIGLLACPVAVHAAQVNLSLQNHQFIPPEVTVPAGQPITVTIVNRDPTPSEFESKTLRVEKVVKGGGTISVQVRALTPGRYRFFDDYHEDTTEGYLVAR